MNVTNSENLEQRFDAGGAVLDYFETDVTLTIDRLAELARILNISALSRGGNQHSDPAGEDKETDAPDGK